MSNIHMSGQSGKIINQKGCIYIYIYCIYVYIWDARKPKELDWMCMYIYISYHIICIESRDSCVSKNKKYIQKCTMGSPSTQLNELGINIVLLVR